MSVKAFSTTNWILDRGPTPRWQRRINDQGQEESQRILYLECHQEFDAREIANSSAFDDFIDYSIIPFLFRAYIPGPRDAGGSVLCTFPGTWYIDDLDPVIRNGICRCRLNLRRVATSWTLTYSLT